MYQGEFTEKELIGCMTEIVGSEDRLLIQKEMLNYTGREIDEIVKKWKSANEKVKGRVPCNGDKQ
jgi:hypothetical protein|tara:strand:- start:215 stop:409 length:195 start_codon:yes stop_codon:yes gene_type:complete